MGRLDRPRRHLRRRRRERRRARPLHGSAPDHQQGPGRAGGPPLPVRSNTGHGVPARLDEYVLLGPHEYLHRRAERALITAETVAAMATLRGAPRAASLEDHWRLILRNEFHDILPGSQRPRGLRARQIPSSAPSSRPASSPPPRASTPSPRTSLPPSQHRARPTSSTPTSHPRPVRVASPTALPGSQPVDGGHVLAADATIPGLTDRQPSPTPPRPPGLAVTERSLENAHLRVTLNDDGTLASVSRQARGNREALAGRGNQIWTYVDKPRSWDAWDIDESYPRQGTELAFPAESNDHRDRPAPRRDPRHPPASGTARSSSTSRLWAQLSPRLDIATEIDWHDHRRTLVKARFPLAIRSGLRHLRCAPTASPPADPPQHALGHRPLRSRRPPLRRPLRARLRRRAAERRQVRPRRARQRARPLRLLRSPAYPDPLADEGRQSFTYALLPHAGDWLTGGVLAEAEDLNQPLLAKAVTGAGPATGPPHGSTASPSA